MGVAEASASFRTPLSNAVEQVCDDPGGYIADYVSRVRSLRSNGHSVAFTGRCGSACTLLLSLPGDQLCVTSDASFVFHAPSAPSATGAQAAQAFLMSEYPRWVREWIFRQGGLSATPITMSAAYYRQYLRLCGKGS